MSAKRFAGKELVLCMADGVEVAKILDKNQK